MRKLAVVVVVLVVLAVAVEVVVPRLASQRIEDHVSAQTSGVVGVSASLGTFPVVTRLLATEQVQRLDLTLDEVAGQALPIAMVRVELEGVTLDRGALLGGDVRVTDIDRGRATAVVDLDVLSNALGIPVRVEDGTLVAAVLGRELRLPLQLDGRTLQLPSVPGLSLPNISLPDIVPCAPTETAFRENRIELSCTLDAVPGFLT